MARKDVDGFDIYIGLMSGTRRIRMCHHYDYDINDEGDGHVSRSDERLHRNWCYTREGREPHSSFTLTLPNGLSAIIDCDGHYTSYRDYEGIAQDMTKDLAIEFDRYLAEITGIGNKHMTN